MDTLHSHPTLRPPNAKDQSHRKQFLSLNTDCKFLSVPSGAGRRNCIHPQHVRLKGHSSHQSLHPAGVGGSSTFPPALLVCEASPDTPVCRDPPSSALLHRLLSAPLIWWLPVTATRISCLLVEKNFILTSSFLPNSIKILSHSHY